MTPAAVPRATVVAQAPPAIFHDAVFPTINCEKASSDTQQAQKLLRETLRVGRHPEHSGKGLSRTEDLAPPKANIIHCGALPTDLRGPRAAPE